MIKTFLSFLRFSPKRSKNGANLFLFLVYRFLLKFRHLNSGHNIYVCGLICTDMNVYLDDHACTPKRTMSVYITYVLGNSRVRACITCIYVRVHVCVSVRSWRSNLNNSYRSSQFSISDGTILQSYKFSRDW